MKMKDDKLLRSHPSILHGMYQQRGLDQCGNEDWLTNLEFNGSISEDRDLSDTFRNDELKCINLTTES